MRNLSLIIVSLFLLAGCAPPKPEVKILKEQDGITCSKIEVFFGDKPLTTPVLPLDTTIEMVFSGLSGFRENSNLVYPGGTLKVIDENREVIFTIEDVFLSLNETGADKKLVNDKVTMILETGSPMKKGHTYTWENTIWDKRANRKIIGKINITIE